MDTSKIKVFDNGGFTLDRYTVFPYLESKDAREQVMYLGLSNHGLGVSMWGEINRRDLQNLSFLGEEIPFCDLSKETQNHILNRVKE